MNLAIKKAKREANEWGVLTAFACACQGLTQEGALDLFVGELERYGVLYIFDENVLRTKIETGFALHYNNPQLTADEVLDLALDAFVFLSLPGVAV